MTSHTTHGSTRGVLSIDIPDHAGSGPGAPSAELLDRALVGWERFTGAWEETSDD